MPPGCRGSRPDLVAPIYRPDTRTLYCIALVTESVQIAGIMMVFATRIFSYG
jgi:hypothetical protein